MENKYGFSLVELLIALLILGFSSLILIQHQYQLILRQHVIEKETIEADQNFNHFELFMAGCVSTIDKNYHGLNS